MTLNEAITYCYDCANKDSSCAMEHHQLAHWLEELAILKHEKEPSQQVTFKENELYQEISLFHGHDQIGEAEIDLTNHMLAKLVIYELYQNQGFGQQVVKILTEKYNLNNLWVRADNHRAIHVYENCGFQIKEPTMYKMEMGV